MKLKPKQVSTIFRRWARVIGPKVGVDLLAHEQEFNRQRDFYIYQELNGFLEPGETDEKNTKEESATDYEKR